jgi:SAM-dependent methyltransferase
MAAGRRIRRAMGMLEGVRWRSIALRVFACPLCSTRRVAVKLADDEMFVRCLGCRGSAVSMSLAAVLRSAVPDLGDRSVYELSARGPFHAFLKRRAADLTSSEYFDQVPAGAFVDGVQCQDVQRLTYADDSFDVCTSTEVFEHVPDDRRGFSEVRRVLKPGGMLLFTVPLSGNDQTVERARLTPGGAIEHLLPPELHGDPQRAAPVLAFRTYGRDIIDRLTGAGFARATIVRPADAIPWGYARSVVVAHR